MENWRDNLVGPETSILKVIELIDHGSAKIALVVDREQRLLGTITDGDVRRGILRGIGTGEGASRIMNAAPTSVREGADREGTLALMNQRQLRQIPVVDGGGRVVGLERLDALAREAERDNLVVLMAGGLGSRLQPLTNETPKPMLKVGGKPILENILENFLEYGFRQFRIAVNFKAEVIQSHFGDGSRWGARIEYLREDRPLGTAGALSLLPQVPAGPILVMNGDLLTKVNFSQLLDFHQKQRAEATMCVREYDFQVPYGVVKLDGTRLVSIDEKPAQRFFVNAGIYVLEPGALSLLPKGEFCDMPSLFERLAARGRQAAVFPIREYWLDIGHLEDFERANVDFGAKPE